MPQVGLKNSDRLFSLDRVTAAMTQPMPAILLVGDEPSWRAIQALLQCLSDVVDHVCLRAWRHEFAPQRS